jgi:hypothetical protein
MKNIARYQAYLHLVELSLLAFVDWSIGSPQELAFTEMLETELVAWHGSFGYLADPKTGRRNGLIYHEIFRFHKLLVASIFPVHFREVVLIHNRKHGMNVLEVI